MTNTTKLVHVTTIPQSLRWFRGQNSYLYERGYQVSIISSPGPLLKNFSNAEQVPTYAIPMSRSITPFKDLRALLQMLQVLRKISPSIVHAHTPKASLLAMLAARITQVPVRIYHVHGLRYSTLSGLKRRLLMFGEWVTCRMATKVFSVSPSVRKEIVNTRLCPPDKIKVLLNGSISGVDTKRFDPLLFPEAKLTEIRSRYNIPDGSLVMGFVGRFVRDKGMVELVKSWQELRTMFPHLHFLLVGRFEKEDPVPIETKQILLTDPRCHITGYLLDIRAEMALMDVVVLPTYREGFPNTVLEANAMSRPIVASRVTGCIDAVQDGKTGTLIPAKDIAELTKAIARYLRDPLLRRNHGEAGRAYVMENYSPEMLWQVQYQEYQHLLASHAKLQFA